MRRLMLVVALTLVFATNVQACYWDCLITTYDDNSDGGIDAMSARCIAGTEFFGSMSECRVRLRCRRFPNGAEFCESYCDGPFCVIA